MPPITDPHQLFSEITPGEVSAAFGEYLPRICITGDGSTQYLARERSRCRDQPAGVAAMTRAGYVPFAAPVKEIAYARGCP